MKRKLIALFCLLCLAVTACGAPGQEQTTAPLDTDTSTEAVSTDDISDDISEDITDEETTPMIPETFPTTPGTFPVAPSVPDFSELDTPAGDAISLGEQGKARITYTGNRNYVKYITSADMLAGYDIDALAAYDEAFFRDHALILVCETVGSGSVQLAIDGAYKNGEQISVVLSHHMPGDVGTADMATWLLWAEVTPGLENCQWELHNAAQPSQGATH